MRLIHKAKMRCSRQDNCQICGARQVVVFFAAGHEVDHNHIDQWFDKVPRPCLLVSLIVPLPMLCALD